MPKMLCSMMAAGISASLATEGTPASRFSGAFHLLAVHRGEEVEGHQAEMHGAASRIEQSDLFDGRIVR